MARPGTVRSRRNQKEAEDPRNRWLTTYADAVTLLMAFFILLYAMSEIDVIKFSAFLEGLRVPFGNEAGDGLLPETDGLQPDIEPRNPETERPELSPELQQTLSIIEREEAIEDQLRRVEEALNAAVQKHGLEIHVEIRREERGLVVSIASDDILFALGSTEINEVGQEVIRVVSETLDDFPNPLFIEGHTDDIPIARPDYTNWNLSTDRAVAVLQLMIEEHELPSDRVGAVGYGEYHPLDTNDTPQGRARNRRVDIVVLVSEETL